MYNLLFINEQIENNLERNKAEMENILADMEKDEVEESPTKTK